MHESNSNGDDSAPMRRSQGQIVVARGLWYVAPGRAELRTERLPPLRPGQARINTEYSAISRGTERMVAHGEVPQSEWERMRAPLQVGNFPFPVKYGYSATGTVVGGSDQLIGRQVFALHPHQDAFQVAESALFELPAEVPTRRATLAANMETALNAHWDAQTAPGDRVLVIGAGTVGLLVARIAARIAGTKVVIADIDPNKANLSTSMGAQFIKPTDISSDYQLVFHASGTAEGLQAAIDACALEGRVIELSWYGSRQVSLSLGGAFHSRRLKLISSQVGHVAPSHRPQVTPNERLRRAISLLDDPILDRLVENEIAFDELPAQLQSIWSASSLPPIVRY